MNCEDFELYGSAYIDNMLSNKEKLEFENHINECECCNVKFRNLEIIIESVNEIEEVELPINFYSELKTKLEIEKVSRNKNIIFNRKKLLRVIVAGLFIIITSVSLLNNSSIYKNKDNLNGEIHQMSENQENITFDIASEESAQAPDSGDNKSDQQPRMMAIENADKNRKLAVEDSIEETDKENTDNIMTAENNGDSLQNQDSQNRITDNINNKTVNLFVSLIPIVGMGILIYKRFKK